MTHILKNVDDLPTCIKCTSCHKLEFNHTCTLHMISVDAEKNFCDDFAIVLNPIDTARVTELEELYEEVPNDEYVRGLIKTKINNIKKCYE